MRRKTRPDTWTATLNEAHMCRKTKAGLKEELINEFPESLNDQLNKQPMRSGEPMHIHLQDGARPRKTTVPRQVAKRFEHAANTTLNELIARGVLVKEPGATEWCSPAVWVPKGDNVRMRLCTDYRELNKQVKRPVYHSHRQGRYYRQYLSQQNTSQSWMQ